MTAYTFDKYEYKRYLLETLTDCRQEDLMFWKKTIPMPVDLIYTIFEKRGVLFKKYLDHIGAAYLYAFICHGTDADWPEALNAQPTELNLKHKNELTQKLALYLNASAICTLLSEFAELLLLENYHPNETDFADALCHDGRKYKRLWLPPIFREKIKERFPALLQHMSKSNWDMFANVVADELCIYRMGFADAFTGIFNKLIEFVLLLSSGAEKGHYISNAIDLKISQTGNPKQQQAEVVYGAVSDGSIWEPVYQNGRTTFIFNDLHPYCNHIRKQKQDAEKVLSTLIAVMAEKENEIVRQSDKKLIEIFRQDISRELRIIFENGGNHTTDAIPPC